MINISKKMLIITHTFATGPTQELRDYLIKNEVSFSFIEHPFSYNKNQKQSQITYFKKGKETKCYKGDALKGPEILHYITDFIHTIYFAIRMGQKYDYCIAADNLNALAAWFLQKLGYVAKVIYWTIDYSPKRFDNSLLNNIYHAIDRFCCYHADILWNSSGRMREVRGKNGVDVERCAKEILVYDGCHFTAITRYPDSDINRLKLVFMGRLEKGKGVDLIIEAMPELLKKYPGISLTIIGTGPEEETLINLIAKLAIEEKVLFTGFIKEHKDLERIIASCGIAVAPYLPDPNSYTFFSEVGKVKIYLACGLPVLITDVPEFAKTIEEQGAGRVFEYNKESFLRNAGILLSNETEYFKCRHSAIELARKFEWDTIFECAINETVAYVK